MEGNFLNLKKEKTIANIIPEGRNYKGPDFM